MYDVKLVTGTTLAHKSRHFILMISIIFSFISISLIELLNPSPIAVWVLYIPIISLTFFFGRPWLPLFIATLSAGWTFFTLIPDDIHSSQLVEILERRSLGTIAFFSVALIVRFAILTQMSEQQTKLELEKSATELARERLKLERSNRELEQFAGVAAHDLKSPIALVYSCTDILNHLIPPPRTAELDQALTIIRRNAKKADDLIRDILEISRLNVSVSNIVQVDLSRTLNEILVTLAPQIQNAQAQIHISPLPTVQGNQTHLTSIFTNLIRNALIYRDKTRAAKISVGYSEQVDTYEFYVKDNGLGIDPLFKEQIFEMFKRLHIEKEYSGTGIGLAFCKRVVELSGGKIWVDSKPGQGSTFFFTYPKVWWSVKHEI